MPRAGRYEFPTRDIDDCIGYLKRAQEVTKDTAMTRETFAEAISMSPKGGGFGLLVGSMVLYKLVSTGDGYVRYTDLAKKALFGELSEQEEAKSQAVRNISLLGVLYDQFGSEITDVQLRIFLREKANVEISEANSLAVEIGKLYKKVVNHIKPNADSTPESGNGGESGKLMTQNIPTGGEQWAVITPHGTIKIENKESYKAALALIGILKQKYADADEDKEES